MIKPTDRELIARGEQTEEQRKKDELARAIRTESYDKGEDMNRMAELQRRLAFEKQENDAIAARLTDEDKKAAEARRKIFEAQMRPI